MIIQDSFVNNSKALAMVESATNLMAWLQQSYDIVFTMSLRT